MSSFSLPRPSGQTVLPLVTVGVWTLAAASIVFWALHMPKTGVAMAVSVPAPASQPSADLSAPIAKALGQTASAVTGPSSQTGSDYQLMGVIVSASGQGSALIAVDGQPAKAYRVGQTVQDGWTLASLTARQARLTSSTLERVLALPAENKP
ncbi:type II secretion system protein N [Limnohabitans sp. T6-20]|uniref:type II secretion system protein N n=1 Tax=Limnohabitans sp. T6-20 TaxID=1100725 RepID=UPI000D3B22DF|nr:type II secretion system protein N [Limnohabitans sp. T6-20]PUE12157.1 hypothetical protein B9Z33_00930 [Limnohabitans sp. T6-20]